MNREEAIAVIERERKESGTDEVVAFVENDAPGHVTEDRLQQAVDILGMSRVRQVLGLNGEPWLTVVTARGSDSADKRRAKLLTKIRSLWDNGKIASFGAFSIPRQVSKSNIHTDNSVVQSFIQYQSWATRHDLTLEPFFRQTNSGDTLVFPEMFLEVRGHPGRLHALPTGDRDASVLQGVFPCADGERQYSIDDYLTAVAEEQDWRERPDHDDPTHPDYGAHGAIKGYIFRHPDDTVGAEWELPEDEKHKGSEEDQGRIDIVFKHKTDEKRLLVEVKPENDKGKIDSAIGQVGRYKYQLLADSPLPHLSPNDIHLAIAAPGFHESHRQIAKEWDIDLIEVPRSQDLGIR